MCKLLAALLTVSCLPAFAQGNTPITGYDISKDVYENNSLLAEHNIELLPGFGVAAPGFSATLGQPYAVAGRWDGVYKWPIVAIHNHLLPSGQVITWQGHNDDTHDHTHPYLWDPATASLSEQPAVADNIFCSGHTLLVDGRLFVAGGHDKGYPGYIGGLKIAYTYDFPSNQWTKQTDMRRNRWYPTCTTLSNGDILTTSGETEPLATLDVDGQRYRPELWHNGSWSWLNNADKNRQLPLYPMMFLAPDGRVFNAGPNVRTGFLDVTNGGSWTDGPLQQLGRNNLPPIAPPPATPYAYNERQSGTAVMYAPGKILLMGGEAPNGGNGTATTERINLNDPNPGFVYDAPMQYARFNVNSTLLPDGTVLVTGGIPVDSRSDADAVLYPELWTPPAAGSLPGTNGGWTRLNPMSEPRLYHSTALLLPDGRVLSAGGGHGALYTDHPTAEVFSPPYLFKGARPVITAVPPRVGYGQPLTFNTPDAGTITAVSWIRLSSVTHSFNMNQRFQWLPIASRTTGSVTVTAPGSPTASPPDLTSCPPGHYLLFALRNGGVPSEARIVVIGDNTCATLNLATSRVFSECAVQAQAQVSGTNVGSNFRWYIDGVYDPTYDGQTTVAVQLHNCRSQVTFAVEADATCDGPALARSAVVKINPLKSGGAFCPCQ